MKAIFAVSALAAAISAQAIAADTETTTTFTGGVKFESIYNLEAETRDNALNGDDTKLEGEVSVVNGPFSGSLKWSDGDEVSLGDLKVDNGVIAFGQGLGTIVVSDEAVDDMADHDYEVGDVLRYTNADMGVKVQLEEGTLTFDHDDDDDTDSAELATTYGVAAAYATDLGVATVSADVQYREIDETALPVYAGVKAVAKPVDMLTLTAGYAMGHGAYTYTSGAVDADGNATGSIDQASAESDSSSYGVRADVAVMEGVTSYGYYSQVADADANIAVGAAATFAPLTVSADLDIDAESYEFNATLAETVTADALTVSGEANATYADDLTWDVTVSATYAISDMTSAGASAYYEDDGGMKLTANVTHTTAESISLAVDYTNTNEDHEDGVASELKLTAAYSF